MVVLDIKFREIFKTSILLPYHSVIFQPFQKKVQKSIKKTNYTDIKMMIASNDVGK